MSSIQQVVTGGICLVAAFAFGRYINQNPSLGHLETAENAEVKLTPELLSIRRPELILTMTHRKEPEFDASDAADVSLPAPSDLTDRYVPEAVDPPNPVNIDLQIDPRLASPPDFSEVAAEYNDQPVAAPSVDPVPTMPTMEPRTETNLKNLANAFKPAIPAGEAQGDVDGWAFQREPNSSEPDLAVPFAAETRRPPLSAESHQAENGGSGNVRSRYDVLNEGAWTGQRSDAVLPGATVADSKLPVGKKQDRGGMTSVLEPAREAGWQNSGLVRVESEAPATQQQANEQNVRGTSRIPFRLTESGRTNLVRLRDTAIEKIQLQSTEFVAHTVQTGETLQSISLRYYGQPDAYLDIYLANRDRLKNPVQVPSGVSLRIPVYDQ